MYIAIVIALIALAYVALAVSFVLRMRGRW